ncbi:MAG TPA: RNA methyltransferase [Syntrophales bacterium]|nr:RNA methyltransferase [Syntrophales bacterium]
MGHEISFRTPSKSQLKSWKKLYQAKYRREEGLFLAEGNKVVHELLASNWETRAILVMKRKEPEWQTLLSTLPDQIDIYGLSEREWGALTQDKGPEGIIAVAAMPARTNIEELLARGKGHTLVLYRIGNPNNLGAVLRAAHWFGIETIVLSAGSADFTNPKVVRAAMGSLFHLQVIADVDLALALPVIKKHFSVVGSHIRRGMMPHACEKKTALLMGSESHGLPEILIGLADEVWHITGKGAADSLSLPQAAAIMMYECTRNLRDGNER